MTTASIVDVMHIARYSVGLVIPPEVCAIGVELLRFMHFFYN